MFPIPNITTFTVPKIAGHQVGITTAQSNVLNSNAEIKDRHNIIEVPSNLQNKVRLVDLSLTGPDKTWAIVDLSVVNTSSTDVLQVESVSPNVDVFSVPAQTTRIFRYNRLSGHWSIV